MKNLNAVKSVALALLSMLFLTLLVIPSCKHDLLYDLPDLPTDTTTLPIDTTPLPVDTFHCDTCAAGVISFTEDVLPILQSNCAKVGCHNAITHTSNLNTTSYTSLMGGSHKPTSLTGSFWEALTGAGGDPMPPTGPLSTGQLQILQTWIQQGSQNTTCTHICACDTNNVSFASYIYPVVQTYCTGCHQASGAQGGVNLVGYSNVLAQVNNGLLMKSIKHESGTIAMPYNGTKLNDCTISKFQAWVNAGAPNN